jgi:hypothetical protein
MGARRVRRSERHGSSSVGMLSIPGRKASEQFCTMRTFSHDFGRALPSLGPLTSHFGECETTHGSEARRVDNTLRICTYGSPWRLSLHGVVFRPWSARTAIGIASSMGTVTRCVASDGIQQVVNSSSQLRCGSWVYIGDDRTGPRRTDIELLESGRLLQRAVVILIREAVLERGSWKHEGDILGRHMRVRYSQLR